MKRLMAAALLLILLAGEALGAELSDLRGYREDGGYQYLELGTYPYEEDGTEAPVKWRILYLEGKTATLITEYIIDVHQIIETDSYKQTTKRKYRAFHSFPECDLYAWMNGPLLEKICEEQDFRGALIEQENGLLYVMSNLEVMNEDYGFPHTKGGCTVEYPGEVAHPEVWRRVTTGTPYALHHRLYEDWGGKNKTLFVGDTGGSPYWTSTMRATNGKGFFMGIVGKNGHISWSGYGSVFVGVRPAAKVNLEGFEIIGGSGTEEDPWRVKVPGGADEEI